MNKRQLKLKFKMNEKFGKDGSDIRFDNNLDTSNIDIDGLRTEIKPIDDVCAESIAISEQEMADLLNETEALGIEPFEDIENPIQEAPIDYGIVFEGLDHYDFDGKDFNHNSEQLTYLLDGFTEDNWNNMDLEGQKEQITGLFDYVNDELGLENPPNIEYYNEVDEGNYGGYNPETNTLSINEYMLHDSNEAADTVAHELWHAYQHERASNPQSPKDFQYQFGFDNYIRPSDDFDGYQNQLVEAEARAFADQFKGAIDQIRRT